MFNKYTPKFPPHVLAASYQRFLGDCHLCGQPKKSGVLICNYCHQQLQRVPILKIDDKLPLIVGGFYDVPFNRVMSAYKDHEDLSALMVLYHLLCWLPRPKGLTAQTAIIIPTPTTKSRLIKRGFNPVLVLAKFLAYHWQIPLWQGVLREDNQIHQRGLSRSQRLKNVQEDFYLAETIPKVRHAILFDDVVTTGATLQAIAKVVQEHNPKIHTVGFAVLHGKPGIHLPFLAK